YALGRIATFMLYKRLRCVCCHFVAIGRKNCIFCCFWGCFAYIKVEVIMMDQTETINGKLYLRVEDGSLVIVEEPFEIEMLTDLPGWLSLNFTSQKKPRILAYQPH
ncbi:hypothetical protein KVB92_09895, partial [Lentilactobacillus parabuchneri]|uniref:hypothetical protein n=1 Tax=Lentilactobacillus parabuchneri TaxID=152331 RepID=UPI001C4EBBA0